MKIVTIAVIMCVSVLAGCSKEVVQLPSAPIQQIYGKGMQQPRNYASAEERETETLKRLFWNKVVVNYEPSPVDQRMSEDVVLCNMFMDVVDMRNHLFYLSGDRQYWAPIWAGLQIDETEARDKFKRLSRTVADMLLELARRPLSDRELLREQGWYTCDAQINPWDYDRLISEARRTEDDAKISHMTR